jgi:hypothetical protein
LTESDIEAYFVDQAKAHFAFVRKVKWIAHTSAPDRLLILRGRTIWIELKSSAAGPHFPCCAHSRAQDREHQRMRSAGADVRVLWSKEMIDELFGEFR